MLMKIPTRNLVAASLLACVTAGVGHAAAMVWTGALSGGAELHVACSTDPSECGRALQEAIDTAAADATITLDAGKVYETSLIVRPKQDALPDQRLTITTRGWADKGQGWRGLVTPADKPRMAVLRAARRENVVVDIQNGPRGGHVNLIGLAFEANAPSGQGDLIRIGSDEERSAGNLASQISIRQVLMQGDRGYGQKRGIAANGRDIDIQQVWCEEMFQAGQDAQCIAAWNGGQRVHVQYAYLAAGAENLLLGGARSTSAEVEPRDWVIEDVILHKPLRWREDRANRQVKNLLEFKRGVNITARRILAVNNWRAAQDGTALLVTYMTSGACPHCGGLENVLLEDVVVLNVDAGVFLQGYSWREESRNKRKLHGVTLRNVYMHLSTPGRAVLIANVLGRHDIRIERSTFLNQGTTFVAGSYGRAWVDETAPVRGGPIGGLWLIDNVFAANGTYGITAPDGSHFGKGIGTFVNEDLQIAGNVVGDAPAAHLENYNRYTNGGPPNVAAPGAWMTVKMSESSCSEWAPGKGADCARLRPIFALLSRLPEP